MIKTQKFASETVCTIFRIKVDIVLNKMKTLHVMYTYSVDTKMETSLESLQLNGNVVYSDEDNEWTLAIHEELEYIYNDLSEDDFDEIETALLALFQNMQNVAV